jgi:catechol-2,3-dioxygenase
MADSNGVHKVLSPSKLAHVVLHTHQSERMVKFYLRFLGASIAFSNEHITFLSYDDEHHRIAIAAVPGLQERDPGRSGLGHIAFTYDSLKDLCTAYKQRKAMGMTPGLCIVSHSLMSSYTLATLTLASRTTV